MYIHVPIGRDSEFLAEVAPYSYIQNDVLQSMKIRSKINFYVLKFFKGSDQSIICFSSDVFVFFFLVTPYKCF